MLSGAAQLTEVPFWKLQAIGNDFPLFHGDDVASLDLTRLAIAASDRRFGIGGDGILVSDPVDERTIDLRMFNPDGTEDFCGNGLRIAARHAVDQGWVKGEFVIWHGGQSIAANVEGTSVSTTLGIANYSPAQVPTTSSHELFDTRITEIGGMAVHGSALTTGSTHLVIPVEELPDDSAFSHLGPALEYLPLFPERTSVIFCQTLELNKIRIRIWERGVGETLGCGTGSSAAAADYFRRNGGGGTLEVVNPGGSIFVSMESWNRPIQVVGTAHEVFRGTMAFEAE